MQCRRWTLAYQLLVLVVRGNARFLWSIFDNGFDSLGDIMLLCFERPSVDFSIEYSHTDQRAARGRAARVLGQELSKVKLHSTVFICCGDFPLLGCAADIVCFD